MQQSRLTDAAIALQRVLARSNVRFGIFGGFAIGALGGPRESKDIDCLASGSKEQIINILDGQDGFVVVPQSRTDYVAFLWSDAQDRSRAVLVEIFCEQYPGASHTMQDLRSTSVSIQGQAMSGSIAFLDPFYLFKGKLSAAATRAKFHDSADLRWLESHYNAQLCAHSHELDLSLVGLALKRYEELEWLFQRIGVNTNAARQAAASLDPHRLPRPQPGSVQRALLG